MTMNIQRIVEPPTKAKPHREEDGIFSYRGADGETKYLVRVQCRGEQLRKFGFPTITKARLWRDVQRNLASGLFLEDTPKSGKMRRVDLTSDLRDALSQ